MIGHYARCTRVGRPVSGRLCGPAAFPPPSVQHRQHHDSSDRAFSRPAAAHQTVPAFRLSRVILACRGRQRRRSDYIHLTRESSRTARRSGPLICEGGVHRGASGLGLQCRQAKFSIGSRRGRPSRWRARVGRWTSSRSACSDMAEHSLYSRWRWQILVARLLDIAAACIVVIVREPFAGCYQHAGLRGLQACEGVPADCHV